MILKTETTVSSYVCVSFDTLFNYPRWAI